MSLSGVCNYKIKNTYILGKKQAMIPLKGMAKFEILYVYHVVIFVKKNSDNSFWIKPNPSKNIKFKEGIVMKDLFWGFFRA